MLSLGEPAPWFHAQALSGNPRYAFDTAAGRWIIMLFMGSGANEAPQAALRLVQDNRELFDDQRACFFGVTIDRSDAERGRVAQKLPGIRWFLDYDRQISALYGAIKNEGGVTTFAPHWLLLDPMLRVHGRATLANGSALFDELRQQLDQQADMLFAPVLIIPNVLSNELCHQLIELYEHHGGTESGFMREENGVTVSRLDHGHKRRADYTIIDEHILAMLKGRISEVLRPMIRRAFQFDASRIERFIVACYDGAQGGHFRPHRDNTTKGTAHRKFAVTINLNAEDFEGGALRFPEFGPGTYRAPTGGAAVFSCSLLHEAQPVTKGRRYAFLPFLYDDDGARLRERNLTFVAPELRYYRSGLPPE
jgi:predicted 2-oxoglutarate/Fe(II)-dependent dioxygenase YbiX/peroxiredoxin